MKAIKFLLCAVAVMLPGLAAAAVPAEVTTLFGELVTDFGTILGLAFGLLAVVTGGWIMLGWGRRAPKKAAA